MGGVGVTLAFALMLVVGVFSTGSGDVAVASPETEATNSTGDVEDGAPPGASGTEAARGAAPQGSASDADVETIGTSEPGARASEAASSHAGDSAEGIKVHGHWTIVVRDPDGTLVERREFDNALHPVGGVRILPMILGRVESVGNWQILTISSPAEEVCVDGGANPVQTCIIAEATDPLTLNQVFKTLAVTVPGSRLDQYHRLWKRNRPGHMHRRECASDRGAGDRYIDHLDGAWRQRPERPAGPGECGHQLFLMCLPGGIERPADPWRAGGSRRPGRSCPTPAPRESRSGPRRGIPRWGEKGRLPDAGSG
jgi:hypothetical protein